MPMVYRVTPILGGMLLYICVSVCCLFVLLCVLLYAFKCWQEGGYCDRVRVSGVCVERVERVERVGRERVFVRVDKDEGKEGLFVGGGGDCR